VIVSLPTVAVNATPVNASVGGVLPSEKFSAALAAASGSTPDMSASPKVLGATDRGTVTKGSTKSSTKSSTSSTHSTADVAAPPAGIVPIPSGRIFDTAPFPTFLPLVPESAASGDSGTILDSRPAGNLDHVAAPPAEFAPALPPSPPLPPPVSIPPELGKARPDPTSVAPTSSASPEVPTPVLPTPSGDREPIAASPTDIPLGKPPDRVATIVTRGEQSTKIPSASATAGKSEPAATSSTVVTTEVPSTPAVPPPVSVPAEFLRAPLVPTDVLARAISPQVAAPVLPTPPGDSKSIPAPALDIPKQDAGNEIAPILISGGQVIKASSAVDPSPSKATADTRLPSRDGAAHSAGTSEAKTVPISAFPEQRKAVVDVAPMFVVSAPPLPHGDIKPQSPQKAPNSEGPAPAKPEVAGAPSSSETSQKDGNTDGNAGSPSGNSNSPKPVSAPMAKPGASDAVPQASGPSVPNAVGSAQVSPAIEGKAVATTVSSKTTDPAARNLGQLPTGVTDAEATAENAASHVISSLQAAKLVERAGQTELRVGIPAGEFGSVDIRTSMGRNQFTAEISVERAELGRALTAELPALHNRLAEQRVPPANIILQERSSGGSSGDLRQGSRHNPYSQTIHVTGAGDTDAMPLIALEAMEDSRGLDIHI